MPSSRFATFLVLVCMAWAPFSSGFATSTKSSSMPSFVPSKARLHHGSVPEEPIWFELPSSSIKDKVVGVQAIEDILGRFAMVAAAGLIVGEVVTGESVTEQFADAISNLVT